MYPADATMVGWSPAAARRALPRAICSDSRSNCNSLRCEAAAAASIGVFGNSVSLNVLSSSTNTSSKGRPHNCANAIRDRVNPLSA